VPRKGKAQSGFAAAWDAMFAMEGRGVAMLWNCNEERRRGKVSQSFAKFRKARARQRLRGKGEVKQGLATA